MSFSRRLVQPASIPDSIPIPEAKWQVLGLEVNYEPLPWTTTLIDAVRTSKQPLDPTGNPEIDADKSQVRFPQSDCRVSSLVLNRALAYLSSHNSVLESRLFPRLLTWKDPDVALTWQRIPRAHRPKQFVPLDKTNGRDRLNGRVGIHRSAANVYTLYNGPRVSFRCAAHALLAALQWAVLPETASLQRPSPAIAILVHRVLQAFTHRNVFRNVSRTVSRKVSQSRRSRRK